MERTGKHLQRLQRLRNFAGAVTGLALTSLTCVSAIAADGHFALKGMALGMTLSEARQVSFPDRENIRIWDGRKLGPIKLACQDEDTTLHFPNFDGETPLLELAYFRTSKFASTCKYSAVEYHAATSKSVLHRYQVGYAGGRPSEEYYDEDYMRGITYGFFPKDAPADEKRLGWIEVLLNHDALDDIIKPFILHFGEPFKSVTELKQNAFGRTFNSREITWVSENNGGEAILLSEYYEKSQQSRIFFTSGAYMDYSARMKAADAGKKSNDF